MSPEQFRKMENELRAKHALELQKLEESRKEMLSEQFNKEETEMCKYYHQFEDEWIDEASIRDVYFFLRNRAIEAIKAEKNGSHHGNHELAHIRASDLAMLFSVAANEFAKKADEKTSDWLQIP